MLSYLERQKELTPVDGWDYADKRMSHPLYLEGFEAGRAVERELSEPAAEWSEEEKGILLECVSVLQNIGHWALADKLFSLRPQSHWKPSEEQMEILGRFNDPVLKSLSSDLKNYFSHEIH